MEEYKRWGFLLWAKFLHETFNSIHAAENQANDTEKNGNGTKDELIPGLVEETSETIIKDDREDQNQSTIGKGTEKRHDVAERWDFNSDDGDDNHHCDTQEST